MYLWRLQRQGNDFLCKDRQTHGYERTGWLRALAKSLESFNGGEQLGRAKTKQPPSREFNVEVEKEAAEDDWSIALGPDNDWSSRAAAALRIGAPIKSVKLITVPDDAPEHGIRNDVIDPQ